ncbi:MAG: c-type cytochrome [Betaproteobacteria bacterium]|nr:c-type cytochrome [Betaproteobacteria bacterium]
MRTTIASRVGLAVIALLAGFAASAQEGKQIYEQKCAMCHATGLAGAPRPGNAADWAPRLKAGKAVVYRNAVQGTPRGMPPKGGNADLAESSLRAAVDYMIGGATVVTKPAVPKLPEPPIARAPVPEAAAQKPPAQPPVAPAAPVVAAAAAAPVAVASATRVATASAANAPEPGSGAAESNAFNRLLKPIGRRNLPPAEDGIHDSSVDGTLQLQPPLSAFSSMPRSNAGNRVDWVKALAEKKIAPRWERDKADAAATVMDLNIVREVKGSMPDVVYPHKQHTEWLDCSNCHPAIFAPQKGANQMSMAAILLGQGCGTCHGRVAFPVSECRLCHSKKKDAAASTAASSAGQGK